MKRARSDSQPQKSTTTIVPADVKSSRNAKTKIVKAGIVLHNRLRDALADHPEQRHNILVRIETCYDADAARGYGAPDNISRRFARTSLDKLNEAVDWPTTAISIHEVIPAGVPVKVWFDIDDFDIDTHYTDFITDFTERLHDFMRVQYGIDIDPDSDCMWMHSIKYADEPESEPRCIRRVVKNSLHLTMPYFYVESNEVHMRQLASDFLALHPDICIDLQVYTPNSSIRVVGSCKLTEPWRPVEMHRDDPESHDTPNAYVTNVNTDHMEKIDVVTLQQHGPDDPNCVSEKAIILDIMRDVCDDTKIEFSHCHLPVGDGNPWWAVSVKDVKFCIAKGGPHSSCNDVRFSVSPFHPYVIQSCFSGNCKGAKNKVDHSSGYFGELTLSAEPSGELVETYLKHCMMHVEVAIDSKEAERFAEHDAKVEEHEMMAEERPHKKQKKPKKPKKMSIKQRKDEVAGMMAEFELLVFARYYNRFFSCIINEGTFLIGVEYMRCEAEFPEGRKAKRLVDRKNFLSQFETLPKIVEWLKSTKRRELQHITFFPWDETHLSVCHSPGNDNDGDDRCATMPCVQENVCKPATVPYTHGDNFNQWLGLRINHQDAWDYDFKLQEVQPFLDHIYTTWCEEDMDLADWVLQWLAHVYTKPWIRLNSCIILQGMKGTGKGIIMDIMGRLIGDEHYWQIGNLNNLTGNYTHPKMSRSVLAFVDEAYWGGDPKAANALKGIITEKRQDSNVKYQPQRMVDSYMNVCCASNNDKIVQITRDNRRYQFLRLANLDKKPADYFDRLASIKPIAIASYFLHSVCLCNFDAKNIFNTTGASDQLIESFNNVERWWFDILCSDPGEYFDGDKIPVTRLKSDMIDYSRSNNVRFMFPETNHAFMRAFRKMCQPHTNNVRIYINPSLTQLAMVLHDIDTCREQFDVYCKRKMDYSLTN